MRKKRSQISSFAKPPVTRRSAAVRGAGGHLPLPDAHIDVSHRPWFIEINEAQVQRGDERAKRRLGENADPEPLPHHLAQ